ncbi:hypothetical protein [Helicobacter ganmani]|uniref:hypothetical protein n=1 Tax=Helicobacter ganmani TaxID=60246 RepID=UPI003A87199B
MEAKGSVKAYSNHRIPKNFEDSFNTLFESSPKLWHKRIPIIILHTYRLLADTHICRFHHNYRLPICV